MIPYLEYVGEETASKMTKVEGDDDEDDWITETKTFYKYKVSTAHHYIAAFTNMDIVAGLVTNNNTGKTTYYWYMNYNNYNLGTTAVTTLTAKYKTVVRMSFAYIGNGKWSFSDEAIGWTFGTLHVNPAYTGSDGYCYLSSKMDSDVVSSTETETLSDSEVNTLRVYKNGSLIKTVNDNKALKFAKTYDTDLDIMLEIGDVLKFEARCNNNVNHATDYTTDGFNYGFNVNTTDATVKRWFAIVDPQATIYY